MFEIKRAKVRCYISVLTVAIVAGGTDRAQIQQKAHGPRSARRQGRTGSRGAPCGAAGSRTNVLRETFGKGRNIILDTG